MATPDQDYDIAVVLDADNVMAPDFLAKMQAFENDFIAVQGQLDSQKHK
jgi:predicted nucleotidyltransferase